MFKKLLAGILMSATALVLCTNTVEASSWSYNTTLANKFGLSENYIYKYFDKVSAGKYRGLDELDPTGGGALTTEETQALEKQILAELTLAHDFGGVGLGRVFSSDVNSNLTIHFNLDAGGYEIEKSSGNSVIDKLVFNFIDCVGWPENVYAGYNKTGKLVQPTWKVNGSKVEIYVPYVYYDKATRQYLAKQLENKLEALVGKDYSVTFRCSKAENVAKYSNAYNEGYIAIPFSIIEIMSNIKDSNYWSYQYNAKLPVKQNGKYLANPSAIRLEQTSLSDFADLLADYYGYENNGEGHRMALARFTSELYLSPTVTRIILSDYTITVRAGKILDIEDSTSYIKAYNSGKLI